MTSRGRRTQMRADARRIANTRAQLADQRWRAQKTRQARNAAKIKNETPSDTLK